MSSKTPIYIHGTIHYFLLYAGKLLSSTMGSSLCSTRVVLVLLLVHCGKLISELVVCVGEWSDCIHCTLQSVEQLCVTEQALPKPND